MQREFGGYLPLELPHGQELYTGAGVLRLNCGRNAIVAALRDAGAKKVYLPYYNCNTVYDAVTRAGFAVERYPLDARRLPVCPVLGDGECDEGSVWEAALQAHQYKLDNLVAIIDHNRMQSLDFCENTLALEPFGDKWRAFGWNVIETDGNDVDAVEKALRQAQENRGSGRPTVVIAVTTKGKGVSFMENDILWHYRTPQGEEYDAALAELEAQRP